MNYPSSSTMEESIQESRSSRMNENERFFDENETVSIGGTTNVSKDQSRLVEQRMLRVVERMYNTLPPCWSKNPQAGTKTGEAPFIHEDGRKSWKHPNRDLILAMRKEFDDVESNVDGEKGSTGTTEKNQRLLKKYSLMVKRGVPIEAAKQSARVIDNFDFDESDLLATTKSFKEKNTSENREYKKVISSDSPGINTVHTVEHPKVINASYRHDTSDINRQGSNITKDGGKSKGRYFEPSDDHNQIYFTLSSTSEKESHLAKLVQKMILTVNKSQGAIQNSNKGCTSVISASTKDLYNALGALRGVQLSRDKYNITLQHDNVVSHSEIQAKRKPFLELIHNLGLPFPTCPHEKVDIEGLDDLISFVEERYKDELKHIHDDISVGMYDFNALTEMYHPGSRVIAKSVFASGVDMICEVSWSRYEDGKTLFGKSRSFKVCFEFIVAVGEHFTICEYVETMENFEGRRHLQSLNFVPLSSLDRDLCEVTIATYRQRGQVYSRCATGAHFMAYDKGSFFAKGTKFGGRDQTAALRVAGRVMVDTQGSYEAGYSISIGNDQVITSIKQKYKEYMLFMRAEKKKAEMENQSSRLNNSGTTMILFDRVPEEYLEITWPAVIGFSFTCKTWGEILIDGLKDITFSDSAFDNLVLPNSRKRMVKALVRHSDSSFSDIISGKGENSVFLLYGAPGSGKTLTAEAISEMLHRPLYIVSLGQLGVSPTEIERRLGEVLDLCSRWNALILLDEADIFIEKRSSTGTLERNAIVSVMLRLVEYFKGTLFLTSNRVDALDPAFKTRITLALRYDPLDYKGRQQVWLNLLRMSGFGNLVDTGKIQVEEIAKHKLNGREIKNAIRLAMALAEEDRTTLSQETLLETISTLNDFNINMRNAELY